MLPVNGILIILLGLIFIIFAATQRKKPVILKEENVSDPVKEPEQHPQPQQQSA